MSGITVVEFENAVHSEETYLSSELADGPPYTVHGVALGNDDVTKGKSGIKKKWPAEELEKSAETLQGTNLVIDHENSVHGVVGRVTKAGYKEDTGVVYEAELYDEDLAEKIQKGLLEVSVRGLHKDVDDLESEVGSDALVVEDIEFKNLSVVPSGAAPSNTLEMGEHAELSAAELSAFTKDLEAAELQEIEPGMWVQWGENRGVTISQVQDGEIEVDIYEEQDGQWRSIEQTEMVPTDDLSEWDVDEDDIGPAADEEDEESDEEEDSDEEENDSEEAEDTSDEEEENQSPDPPEFEEGDMVQWQVAPSMKGRIVHAPSNQDIVMVEVMQEQDGELTDTGFTVTAGYSDLKKMEDGGDEDEESDDSDDTDTPDTADEEDSEEESQSVEENAAVDRGQFVKWRDHDNNWRHGQIIEIEQEGQQMVATLRRFTETGDKLGETEQKPIQGLDKWDTSFEQETDSVETESVSDDSESAGDSGATVNDLINVLASVVENASTSKDVPTEDAEPDHEPMGSMENMFNRFMEEGGSPDSTLADFIDWLNEQEELARQEVEGEDDILDDPEAIRRMKENDAAYMAFVWQDENALNKEDIKQLSELEERFDDYPEAASENAQMALDAREETDNPNDCGTDVGWKRANQLANGEGLTREQVGKMSAFNRHRSNSEKSDEEGKADCGWMMWKAWGGDEGVDWAQSKLDEIEEENAAELQDYEMHTPDWSGTTESDWSTPDMEDFDTDDLSEIADHFLISATGFPPENFTDLKLPVVEPNGDLNVNALAAVKGGRGVSAVEGLASDMEDEIVEWVNSTANEEFDRDWGKDEEENGEAEMAMDVPEDHRFSSKEDAMSMANELDLDGVHQMEFDGETMWVPGESHEDYLDAVSENSKHGDEEEDDEEMAQYIEVQSGPTQSKTVGGVRVLPGDDLQQAYTGESAADSLTQHTSDTMNEQIEEKLGELDDPVAVEAEELQQLQDKADRLEELSDNIEALTERTEILDEVDREAVEELRDGDDPVVVESARHEELQSEAEQVKGVYAAQLSEHYDAFDSDELSDKFSIEELREKYEDQFGSIEELADSTDAEPNSQDPSEEELEEGSGEGSEEELGDEVAQKQEAIRQKLNIGGD